MVWKWTGKEFLLATIWALVSQLTFLTFFILIKVGYYP